MSRLSLEEGLLVAEKEISWRPAHARRSLSWGEIGRIVWTVLLVVGSVEVLWRDFRAIRHLPHSTPEQHDDLSFGFTSQKSIFRTFKHNVTFVEEPSPETDRAWKALFPGKLVANSLKGKLADVC